MNVTYNGPEGQVNHEVALALAERAVDREVDLPEHPQKEGQTLVGTDAEPVSALLEPGKVYDLPYDLARRLVASSAFWDGVTDYSKLKLEQLQEIAAEREIDGRSAMTKQQLVDALREDNENGGDGA
jgi:hypothetical protein